jgi:hypothetical protein
MADARGNEVWSENAPGNTLSVTGCTRKEKMARSLIFSLRFFFTIAITLLYVSRGDLWQHHSIGSKTGIFVLDA